MVERVDRNMQGDLPILQGKAIGNKMEYDNYKGISILTVKPQVEKYKKLQMTRIVKSKMDLQVELGKVV